MDDFGDAEIEQLLKMAFTKYVYRKMNPKPDRGNLNADLQNAVRALVSKLFANDMDTTDQPTWSDAFVKLYLSTVPDSNGI